MKTSIKLTARFSFNPFPSKDCYMQSQRSTGYKLTQELKAAENGWYTSEELLERVCCKHGVTFGHYLPGQKKKSAFLYTNVLALDFDNDTIKHPEVKDHMVYPEAAIRALQESGIHPNIVYATPSSDYPDRRNGKVKFRVILFFKEIIGNESCATLMHKSRGRNEPSSYWWECCKHVFGLPDSDMLARHPKKVS